MLIFLIATFLIGSLFFGFCPMLNNDRKFTFTVNGASGGFAYLIFNALRILAVLKLGGVL